MTPRALPTRPSLAPDRPADRLRDLALRVRRLSCGRHSDRERFLVEKLTHVAERDRLAPTLEVTR